MYRETEIFSPTHKYCYDKLSIIKSLSKFGIQIGSVKVVDISLWMYDIEEFIKLLPQFKKLELIIISKFGQISDIRKYIKRILKMTSATINLINYRKLNKNINDLKNLYIYNPGRLLLTSCEECINNYYSENSLLCPNCKAYQCPKCGIICGKCYQKDGNHYLFDNIKRGQNPTELMEACDSQIWNINNSVDLNIKLFEQQKLKTMLYELIDRIPDFAIDNIYSSLVKDCWFPNHDKVTWDQCRSATISYLKDYRTITKKGRHVKFKGPIFDLFGVNETFGWWILTLNTFSDRNNLHRFIANHIYKNNNISLGDHSKNNSIGVEYLNIMNDKYQYHQSKCEDPNKTFLFFKKPMKKF